MQDQHNSIENDNTNVELLLVYIKKMQNIADIRITILTKAIISIKKMSCKTS